VVLEESMFVTIRRYSPKNGAINKASLDLLRRQIQNEFLPIARHIPGFHGYYVLSVADRELITLSLCETKEGTLEANRCAADYTLRNPLIFELGCPEVTEGEVLTFAESAEAGTQDGNGNGHGGGEAAKAFALWMEESRGILLSVSER
jgi:hypothetical protein